MNTQTSPPLSTEQLLRTSRIPTTLMSAHCDPREVAHIVPEINYLWVRVGLLRLDISRTRETTKFNSENAGIISLTSFSSFFASANLLLICNNLNKLISSFQHDLEPKVPPFSQYSKSESYSSDLTCRSRYLFALGVTGVKYISCRISMAS